MHFIFFVKQKKYGIPTEILRKTPLLLQFFVDISEEVRILSEKNRDIAKIFTEKASEKLPIFEFVNILFFVKLTDY